jgi:hypothetical protein
MMDKWADFGISAVRYSSDDDKHIEKVIAREDKGDTFGVSIEESREEVINKIRANKTYITIVKGKDNKWKKGQDVHIIVIDGEEFIRTDANKKKSDNLENLPEL